MALDDHVRALTEEATPANERRMVVLVGERAETIDRLRACADTADLDLSAWAAIADVEGPWRRVRLDRGESLLGSTVEGLLFDATTELRPNVLGQSIGAVAGGGLIVLLLPDLDRWLDDPLVSDERFAVVPYTRDDVGSRFRRRFVTTLRAHRGISMIDVSTDRVLVDGLTHPAGSDPMGGATASDGATDDALLNRCLTGDQRRCVKTLRSMGGDGVVVVESHRGRGKSSAAGLAAAGHVREGRRVLVTGPGFESVREGFLRAREVLDGDDRAGAVPRHLSGRDDGEIRYVPPHEVDDVLADVDIVLVDEAAGLPVHTLRTALAADKPTAYLTTVHGYEGTGRGFTVRFRDTLRTSDRPVEEVYLREPIRYAPGDPIEVWLFRCLLLDAAPPATQVVEDAVPGSSTYVPVDRDDLLADEAYLRELFGLLVLAHYRTEPDDLMRVLDAPNLSVRTLEVDGHPVAVALLAEEGGLPPSWRYRLHRGEPIRGHMIPDLFTTQLRDRAGGIPTGIRIVRIATHDAVRSRGLGSNLLKCIEDEFADAVDWLGTGFGMTPRLLSFWRDNGYRTVHLSTSRNRRSGEHSAVMLSPTSAAGERLLHRHSARLLDRLEGQLTDALRDLDPETLAVACAGIAGTLEVDLEGWVWDVIESASGGPGQVSTAPHGFRRLTLAALVADGGDDFSPRQRVLLVRRVLQAHDWPSILETFDDLTRGDARGVLQAAIETLHDRYRSHSSATDDAITDG